MFKRNLKKKKKMFKRNHPIFPNEMERLVSPPLTILLEGNRTIVADLNGTRVQQFQILSNF